MSYPFINLEKSNKAEIIEHLKTHAGIEKSDKESKDALIDAVLEFEENNQLVRPVELMPKGKEVPEPVVGVAPQASDDLNDYPKVEITIFAGADFAGRDDVMVWLNGRSFQIKRDEKVQVPEPIYQLLLDSKTLVSDQQKDGSIIEREVQNYNIQLHGYAS